MNTPLFFPDYVCRLLSPQSDSEELELSKQIAQCPYYTESFRYQFIENDPAALVPTKTLPQEIRWKSKPHDVSYRTYPYFKVIYSPIRAESTHPEMIPIYQLGIENDESQIHRWLAEYLGRLSVFPAQDEWTWGESDILSCELCCRKDRWYGRFTLPFDPRIECSFHNHNARLMTSGFYNLCYTCVRHVRSRRILSLLSHARDYVISNVTRYPIESPNDTSGTYHLRQGLQKALDNVIGIVFLDDARYFDLFYCRYCGNSSGTEMCRDKHRTGPLLGEWHPPWCSEPAGDCWIAGNHLLWNMAVQDCKENSCDHDHLPHRCAQNGCHALPERDFRTDRKIYQPGYGPTKFLTFFSRDQQVVAEMFQTARDEKVSCSDEQGVLGMSDYVYWRGKYIPIEEYPSDSSIEDLLDIMRQHDYDEYLREIFPEKFRTTMAEKPYQKFIVRDVKKLLSRPSLMPGYLSYYNGMPGFDGIHDDLCKTDDDYLFYCVDDDVLSDAQDAIFEIECDDAVPQAAISGPAPPAEQVTVEMITNDAESVPTQGISQPASQIARRGLPTGDASMTSIMTREYLVNNSVAWDTSQGDDTILATFEFPSQFFRSALAPTGLMNFHKWIRSDFEIAIRINHCPFNAGILIVYVCPPGIAGCDDNLCGLQRFPHTFIKAGDEHVARLRVPWMSYMRALQSPTGTGNSSAKVRIRVWSALTAATGQPSTVDMSLWAKAVDPIIAVKRVVETTATMQGDRNPAALKEKHVQSQHTAAPVTTDFADFINAGSQIVRTGLAVAKTVAAFADSPSVPDDRIEARFVTDVPRPVNVSNFRSDNLFDPESNFSGLPTDATFEDLARCPGRMYNTLSWTTSQSATAEIARFIVTPMIGIPSLVGQYRPIPLNYASLFFAYWRGSIEVTLEVVATRFHQGQLFVTWNPDVSTATLDSDYFNLAIASMTIGQADNRLTVRIPYVNQADYRQINRFTTGYQTGNGMFVIGVQNQLTAPSTVSSEVKIVVYISGGPDFELACPVEPFWHKANGAVVPAEPQSQISDTATDSRRPVSFFPDDLVERGYLTRRPYRISEYLRKPQSLGAVTTNTGWTEIMSILPDMRNDRKDAHCMISACYAYTSGGYRLLLILRTTKAAECLTHAFFYPIYQVISENSSWRFTSYNFTPIDSAFLRATTTNHNTQPAVWYENPGVAQLPFRIVPFHKVSSVEPHVAQLQSKMVIVIGCNTAQYVEGYQAAGDDFRFHINVSPPIVDFFDTLEAGGAEMLTLCHPDRPLTTTQMDHRQDRVDRELKRFRSDERTSSTPNIVEEDDLGFACLSLKAKPQAGPSTMRGKPTFAVPSFDAFGLNQHVEYFVHKRRGGRRVCRRVISLLPNNLQKAFQQALDDLQNEAAQAADSQSAREPGEESLLAVPQGVSTVFYSLLEKLRNLFTVIPETLKEVRSTNQHLVELKEVLNKGLRVVQFIADDLLPLFTAAFSLAYGNSAVQCLAAASVSNILLKYAPRMSQQGQENNVASPWGTDGEEGYSTPNESMPAEPQGLSDYYPRFNPAGALSNPLFYLTSSFVVYYFNIISSFFGFCLPSGFFLWIRRSVGPLPGEDASLSEKFAHFVQGFWQGLVYFAYGDSLNVEWERTQLHRVINRLNLFDRLRAGDLLKPEKYESVFEGKLVKQHLADAHEEVKLFRNFAHEIRAIPQHVTQRCSDVVKEMSNLTRFMENKPSIPEPVTIYLTGKPGVGKSVVLSRFLPLAVLTHKNVSRWNSSESLSNTYTVPIGDDAKFWDAYEGQPWVLFDELLQDRTGKEALNVIRCVNSVAMPINKASLESKGKLFRSPFVGVTSNQSSINLASVQINDVLALGRRLQNSFVLSVRPEYRTATGYLDFAAVQRCVEGAVDPKDDRAWVTALDRVWEFRPVNPVSGAAVGQRPLVFSEVSQLLVTSYVERIDSHRNLERFIRTIAGTPQGDTVEASGGESDDAFLQWLENHPHLLESAPYENERLGTVLDVHLQSFREVGNFSSEACVEMYEILSKLNTDELGISQARLMCAIEKGCRTPFQAAALISVPIVSPKPTDTGLAFADFIYQTAKPKTFLKWKSLLAWAVLVCGVGTAGYFAVKFACDFLKQNAEIAQSLHLRRSAPPRPQPTAEATASLPQGQLSFDQSAPYEVIRRNIREINVHSTNGKCQAMQCLCLDQKSLVVPQHFYDLHLENKRKGCTSVVFLTNKEADGSAGEKVPIYIGPDNSARLRDDDGCFVDARLVILRTETISRARDINGLVCESLSPIEGKRETAYILNHSGRAVPGMDHEVLIGSVHNNAMYARPSYMKDSRALIATRVETRAGDCGMPYVLGYRHNRPIVGLHVFLAEAFVGAAPLTVGSIAQGRGEIRFKPTVVQKDEIESSFEKVQNVYWTSNMELVGTGKFGNWAASHFTPPKTKFVPVVWKKQLLKHETWECDYLPAAMKPKDGIHPLFTNAQKYEVTASLAIAPMLHEAAVSHYVAKFSPYRTPRILSLAEGINGYGEHMQPLVLKTSPGVWTAWGFKEGKRHFFDALPQEYDAAGQPAPLQYEFSQKAKSHEVPIFRQTFCQRLESVIERARLGFAPWTIWVSTCKDELRPAAKVAVCKTRVFEQPPLEYVIAVRMYFGDFLSFFKSSAGFKFYHGIGKDKEEVWMEYWRILRQNSKYGMDYDYSNWDGTVGQPAFQFFLDVVEAYYNNSTEEERLVRASLLDALRETYHLIGNQVAHSIQGNKSGNPFTDVFNSVCNTYVQYIAWLALTRQDLSTFDLAVKMLTYGDDVIQSIREDYLDRFNGQSVQSVLAALGYKVTSALKSSVIEKFRAIETLTFLKSPFVIRKGVCWAPLPKPDIYKELCWRPKAFESDEEDLRLRCLTTQKFMAHHGKKALQTFQHQLASKGIPPEWRALGYDGFHAEVAAKQELAVLLN